LTNSSRIRNLNFMRPLMFAATLGALAPLALAAQDVPGRDLLEFPVGTLAEAPVLATHFGGGEWNPAAATLPSNARARFGAATLRTPADQGITAQVVYGSFAIGGATTLGVSVARAAMQDLFRTEFDPRTIGGEIPYTATVASVTAGRRYQDVAIGLSLRYRLGEMDGVRRQAAGADAGFIADRVLGHDVRIAASSYLWQPAHDSDDRPRYSAGLDARLFGPDSMRVTRAGYAYGRTGGSIEDHYVFVSSRYGPWIGRGGMASTSAYGYSSWAPRLGLGVQYARWTVGFAREDTGAGLGPTYQFMLSSVMK
jgi:hypothetical protein